MSVRNGSRLGLAIAWCVVVSQMAHAESGRPSQQALEQMGLGSLVVMSDDEALTVRGQGYMGGGSSVRVFGNSHATINGPNGSASSENGYFAEGKHHAKGSNSSYAGVADIWIGGGHKDKGGKNPRNGQPGGGYGGMPGGGHGGGKPGGGYGNVKVHATIFFSGGHSSAWAF